MGLILYRCDDDFQQRIPVLLAEMDPPIICEEGPEFGSDLDLAFRYFITRGKARIMIYGSREDGIMSLAIVDGSPSLLRSMLGGRARMQLSDDVTKVLVEAGIKEITAEELEELEAQLTKKEAQQDDTGQPATRSQSKSEGGDEHQPESEGRSR
jgi:hypothetical protein